MARREIDGLRGIVTGASSGIGRAIAAELVRQGARLVLVARRRERLETLAAEVAAGGGEVQLVDGDITDAEVRRRAIDRAVTAWGGLDLLVNNAGVGAVGRFESAAPERLRRIMEVNFFAAADLVREALPVLARGTRPIVVNVGSVLGHRAIPHASEYCASKFALRGLTESLRAELRRRGIDMLLVSPGTTATEFHESALERGVYPWPSPKPMSAERVAKKTVAAIRRGRAEIILSFGGRLLVWASRLAPRLIDRVLARYG